MVAMIETLRQEHSDMSQLLDLIEEQLDGEGTPDYNLLHEIAEYCLIYPEQYHHPKEDIIYRALCRRDGRATSAIDDLEAEHEELTVLTREFSGVIERARTRGTEPGDGFKAFAKSFLDYYRRHIEKEERLFYPDALNTLTPEECSYLETQVTDPTDPLFRETVAQRLRSLLKRASA